MQSSSDEEVQQQKVVNGGKAPLAKEADTSDETSEGTSDEESSDEEAPPASKNASAKEASSEEESSEDEDSSDDDLPAKNTGMPFSIACTQIVSRSYRNEPAPKQACTDHQLGSTDLIKR